MMFMTFARGIAPADRIGRRAKLAVAAFAAVCACAGWPLAAESAPAPLEPLRGSSYLEAAVLERLARTHAADFPLEAFLLRVSAAAALPLTGRAGDPARAAAALDRIAGKVRAALGPAPGPRGTVEGLKKVIFRDERFGYDPVPGDPENFLLDTVLEKRRGNCLGLSLVLLAVGERLGIPLYGVYVPGHIFVRYESGAARIAMETAEGGEEREDEAYAREYRLDASGPYLRTFSKQETAAIFLKSVGAAFARKGSDEQAVALYRGAMALGPGVPDGHYNAGVSLQRMGRLDEAIAKYRKALSIDPGMAKARDNLGIALARKGLFVEAIAQASRAVELDPCNPASRGNLAAAYCADGRTDDAIREYLRALTFAPRDPRLRAGLARAYFAGGKLREAAAECDLAEDLGCRFDPEMKAALAPYRPDAPRRRPGGTAAVPAR